MMFNEEQLDQRFILGNSIISENPNKLPLQINTPHGYCLTHSIVMHDILMNHINKNEEVSKMIGYIDEYSNTRGEESDKISNQFKKIYKKDIYDGLCELQNTRIAKRSIGSIISDLVYFINTEIINILVQEFSNDLQNIIIGHKDSDGKFHENTDIALKESVMNIGFGFIKRLMPTTLIKDFDFTRSMRIMYPRDIIDFLKSNLIDGIPMQSKINYISDIYTNETISILYNKFYMLLVDEIILNTSINGTSLPPECLEILYRILNNNVLRLGNYVMEYTVSYITYIANLLPLYDNKDIDLLDTLSSTRDAFGNNCMIERLTDNQETQPIEQIPTNPESIQPEVLEQLAKIIDMIEDKSKLK